MRLRKGFLWKNWGFSGLSSLTWDQKLICPRSNTHFSLLQSNLARLMKILKHCFKVIQRTLRSGENWMRCASCNVILRVYWPNLRAWPNFEHSRTLQPTLVKHDNVSKKKTLESKTAGLVKDAPLKSVPITSIEKISICWRNMPGKIPSISPFYPSNRLFQKPSGFRWPGFWYPNFLCSHELKLRLMLKLSKKVEL